MMYYNSLESQHLPAGVAASCYSSAIASAEAQRVVDRLVASRNAAARRLTGGGGADHTAAYEAKQRGRAAGRKWAEYSELVRFLDAVRRVNEAEAGRGCYRGAAGELDRVLRAAAGVADRAARPDACGGFVDGVQAVWSEVGGRV